MSENIWHDKEVLALLKNRIKEGLKVSGEIIATNAKKEITSGPNKAVDTGQLRDSITSEMNGDTEVRIGTNVEYGVYVELGTYKMPPRPFLRAGASDSKDDIIKIFKAVINI